MTNRYNLLGLGSAALGIIALVLPFASNISPLDVVRWLWGNQVLILLAAPAFLSIPIAAWQLRRLGSSLPTRPEIALAYLLSIGAMLATLKLWLNVGLPWESPFFENLALIACNAALLARNIKRHVARQVTAEMFLLGGYLPGAIIALVGFFPDWDIGAYVVLAASIGYVAKMAVLLVPTERVRVD